MSPPAPQPDPAPASDTVMALTNAVAPASNPAPPTGPIVTVTNKPAPIKDPLSVVMQPVSNAVATVATVIGSVPGTLIALPASQTPVTDAIAAVQQMLTTVYYGALVPLVAMPSDILSLIAASGATPGMIAPTVTAGTSLSAAGAPLLGPPLPSPPAVLPPTTDVFNLPLLTTGAALPVLGGTAAAGPTHELSLSGLAPAAPEAVSSSTALTFLEHAVRAVVVPASLSALAALALPGVGALLIVCAAGVRFGYRQAKAGLALRVAGIARFAGAGPLGVVRSGSLIALRPRGPHAVQSEVPHATGLVDQVA
ncbi:hypothetical protein [Mycobacterium sp. URHB0021]